MKKNSYLRDVKWLYLVLRSLAVAIICLIVIVPAATYVALSLTSVQTVISRRAEDELSRLLGCKVEIGSLGIVPFNRVVLRDVRMIVGEADTVLTARRIGAGVRLGSLASNGPIVINYVELIELDARLKRDSIGAPLNIQPIIDALKPGEPKKQPTAFDLQINTVLLRSSAVSYDILSVPDSLGSRFNLAHIKVGNLRADIRVPRLANDAYAVSIKRMGFSEHCGFTMENLQLDAGLAADGLAVRKLEVELPASKLSFRPMSLPLHGIGSIGEALHTEQFTLELASGSNLTVADVAMFIPFDVGAYASGIEFKQFDFTGNLNGGSLGLALNVDDAASLQLAASGESLRDPKHRSASLRNLRLRAGNTLLSRFGASAVGYAELDAEARLVADRLEAELSVLTPAGEIDGSCDMTFGPGVLTFHDFALAAQQPVALRDFLPSSPLNNLAFTATGAGTLKRGMLNGTAALQLEHGTLNGVQLGGLTANADIRDNVAEWAAELHSEMADFDLDGEFCAMPLQKIVGVRGDITSLRPGAFIPGSKYPEGTIGVERIDVAMQGEEFHSMTGHCDLRNLSLEKSPGGERFDLKMFLLEAEPRHLSLNTDFLSAELDGSFDFRTIGSCVGKLIAGAYPAIVPENSPALQQKVRNALPNDFVFDIHVGQTEQLAAFFHLPFSVIYPASISGILNETKRQLTLEADLPYLRQGSKLIENSSLTAAIGIPTANAHLLLSTTMPTKNGPMDLGFIASGHDNRLNTDVTWKIHRPERYDGQVNLSTIFSRNDDGKLVSNIGINHSLITFNDSTWTINPSSVIITAPSSIAVRNIDVQRSNQYVKISGNVSHDPFDVLTLDLKNFSLDYLFETLGIDKVILGGDATGTFYASSLLSGAPHLETPGLFVHGIAYNRTVFGNALIKSSWDAEERGITLDAKISQPKGRTSNIYGAIFPLNDSLDLRFDVDHVNIAFMQPYMEAFASDISGEASGKARLWGNFKYIDLEGDVLANNFGLKVNFTNTRYTVENDSVHFRPGVIDISNVTIHDVDGNTATLNGILHHKFFKEPRFNFTVSDARNMLVYNETSKMNPRWFGTVYGSGSATINGVPGRIDINVDMSTAPKSVFTFVLLDQEQAEQYSFLTFRDKTAPAGETVITDTIHLQEIQSLEIVNELRRQAAMHDDDDVPSDYNIALQMRVTPEAQLNLVMDPVAGDKIQCYGTGHLRMDYGSANNDLKMYGTYTLDRGDYNFTLQDIIIKDFDIRSGSSIAFQGNPYAAQLNITASYALSANLSDLDESFLQDKDLNRTTVPVHALLKVTGDMRQPEIAFDLEFPTLTSDIYRKVRSIISTDDMMNRQIIYLLALNRFYTPEYMASTTRGNELMSVASSTISSQLSNVLGQISDNWTISPTFRSDRGDFSDMEVDVALSSRLLNNRLLFNGNFGYRDKSLNTNQFVGDFDLEYLLNRSGRWRLKAYNRYNDQNYYLRTAPTTQGVGIIYKQDFDNFFDFLRPLRRHHAADTIQAPTPTHP